MFKTIFVLLFGLDLGRITSAIQCYSCTGVTSPGDCHNIATCQTTEVCFVHEIGPSNYNLGCQNIKQCAISPMVGRSLTSRALCQGCCSSDNCNTNMCSSVTVSADCADETMNCEDVKSVVCHDDVFKTKCSLTCGLCTLPPTTTSTNTSPSTGVTTTTTSTTSSTTPTTTTSATIPAYWQEWGPYTCKSVGVCLMSRVRVCTDDNTCLGSSYEIHPCTQEICPDLVCSDTTNCSSAGAKAILCSDHDWAVGFCRRSCDKCAEPFITPSVGACGDPVEKSKCQMLDHEIALCQDSDIRALCENFCAGKCP